MNLFSLFSNVHHQVVQGEDVEVENISIDSRKVIKGTVYFCIKGLTVDGHSYIEEVSSKGAVAVVVEEYQEDYPDITIIKVENVRKVLSSAASNFFNNSWENFNLIGVTGTNGKSSTIYFMEGILKEYGKKTGIIGTIETRVLDEIIDTGSNASTTPDTIELQATFKKMCDVNVDDVVMEVSSHALALNKVAGVTFEVAIFTNLTQDHLEFHGTMDNYLKEKAKLFNQCNWGIVNNDSDSSSYIVSNSNCKILTYSIDNESDLRAINIEYSNSGVKFDIEYDNHLEKFEILIAGRFSVYNALGTIGAALSMDIPLDIIKRGLKNTKLLPGRIQSIPNELGFSVYVDYAHTPDGLLNIISSIREFTKGRIITVFGCGGDRDSSKRPIMGKVAGENSDYCIITSDNPRKENPEKIADEVEVGIKETDCIFEKVIDREIAINLAIRIAKGGDTVIIAGKGHENYQVFSDTTIHFDDTEVAKEAVKNISLNIVH
jgi:UDP-N-acetylmuramoyl-L-alanyl-D-glutamate--2,6-diaminopimelate ligase